MKIQSQKIIGQNGEIREHLVNKFNKNGFIERTDFLDSKGELLYYSVFAYDIHGNRLLKKEYDKNGEIQSTNEWEFDDQNREIKPIELTSENQIWEWYEKEYINDQIIYLAKDENGEIIHKTIEYLETGIEERFNSKGILYNKITRKFDSQKRIKTAKHINEYGKIIEEHKFIYIDDLEIWEYFEEGKLVKREKRQKDKCQRTTFYLREDENGNSLEWVKWNYDEFGNQIEIENGIEINIPTNKSRIEIKYLKNENGS